MEWVALGRKLNVSICLKRQQLYQNRYGFSSGRSDHWFFEWTPEFRSHLTWWDHPIELLSYWEEPHLDTTAIHVEGRRSWENSSSVSNLEFVKVEPELTYSDIVDIALNLDVDLGAWDSI